MFWLAFAIFLFYYIKIGIKAKKNGWKNMAKIPLLKNGQPGIKKIALAVLFLMIASLVINGVFLEIHKRFALDPYIYIHDGAMQTEEAIKFILKGKNPYTENYFGTPLENRGGFPELNNLNPALYHLVYLPFNIIFSIPFFLAGNFLLHWFDERLVYISIFLLFIALILKWPNKSLERKLAFLTFFTANPLFFIFFADGRNDIFVFFWIALTIYFLGLKKNNYSSLSLALAATSKHSSWLLLPFYFAYLYYQEKKELVFWEKIKNVAKKTYIFFVSAALIIVPFLIWDFNSFVDDTVKYPNGTAYMSYPISGFGFSQMLLQSKLINSSVDYWPFWIIQMIFSLPLLYILLKMQKNINSLSQIIFNFSLLLMTFWLFSRFFNDNYIGFLIMLFLFALFLTKPVKITLSPIKKPI